MSSPIEFTGRVQLWDKGRTRSTIPTITPGFTGLSNLSKTSLMTNATARTIKATEALPSVQISDENGEPILTNYRPISPLLVLLVESSRHKDVKVGQLLACCSKFQDGLAALYIY